MDFFFLYSVAVRWWLMTDKMWHTRFTALRSVIILTHIPPVKKKNSCSLIQLGGMLLFVRRRTDPHSELPLVSHCCFKYPTIPLWGWSPMPLSSGLKDYDGQVELTTCVCLCESVDERSSSWVTDDDRLVRHESSRWRRCDGSTVLQKNKQLPWRWRQVNKSPVLCHCQKLSPFLSLLLWLILALPQHLPLNYIKTE